MVGGYAGRILRVDLTEGRTEVEKLDLSVAYNYLGGRGYAAKLLYDELAPGTDPLSPVNRIVFMTGPLTGTPYPGAGRTAVCSKSPLTGTVADSLMGGSFGAFLKMAGFDGIVFEGASKKPVYLSVDGENVSIEDAGELWGKSTVEAGSELLNSHGGSWVATIGPAGENLARMACVYTAGKGGREGFAGRCGMGAVMGSKRLKAVVVRGTQKVRVEHPGEFEKVLKKIRKIVETHPITGIDGSLARFGTALLVHRITAAGMLPNDNFSGRRLSFDDVDAFSGETVREKYLVRKTACFACPTACGRWVNVGGREGKGAEFENIVMLGPNSGFYEYEQISELNRMCDELGLDAISVGGILGYARKAEEIKGIEDARRLIREIAGGRSKYSFGLAKIGRVKGLLAPIVKGLELPAYDPRGARGIALAYATSNRGACHLRAYTIGPEILSNPEFVDPRSDRGKARLVRRMQDAFAVYDSMIGCKYHGFALFATLDYELDDVAKALTAVTGMLWTGEYLHDVGSRIYDTERLFNIREKFGPGDDRLPGDFGIDLRGLIRAYYSEREWSTKGVPKPVRLRRVQFARKFEVVLSPIERLSLPALQVALDMDSDIETISSVAKDAYLGGARIIEAGTPAVKRHGVDRLIPALRKVAPDAIIVADLKTMDVGNLEARIAFRAGADVSAVLAIGGKTKVMEAISEATRWDRAVLVDFIDCLNPLHVMRELKELLGGHENRVIFCIHRGISEQLKGRGIYEQAQLISEAKKVAGDFLLAVAGGIKEGVAGDVVAAGADICIAGSAIYNSSNPRENVGRIVREIGAGTRKFSSS
ncbi:MAG: orotidine 5'-phosphate decarboxylase / HUMPS family protein [Candidatus Hadarchaeales archaeon]